MTTTDRSTRRVIATTLFVATALLAVSDILFDVVRYRHGALMPDAHRYFVAGAGKAVAFRWAAITDMFGDYLLLIPAALYLRRMLRRDNNVLLLDVATVGGVGFAVVGGAAAAILGLVGAPLFTAYAHAAPAQRPAIAVTFAALTDAVTTATWQTFVALLFPMWLLGLAWELRERERAFAVYSAALAFVLLLGAAGSMAGIKYTGGEPDTLIFLPLNVWIGWIGLLFWRDGRLQSAQS